MHAALQLAGHSLLNGRLPMHVVEEQTRVPTAASTAIGHTE